MKLLEFKNFRQCNLARGVYFFDDVRYRGVSFGKGWLQAQGDDELEKAVFFMPNDFYPITSDNDEEEFIDIIEKNIKEAVVRRLESRI